MNGTLKKSCILAAALALFGVGGAAGAQEAADNGAALYKRSCVSCHTEKPAKLMGKPVEGLVAGMERVRNLTSPASEAVQQMQKVLQPLTAEQVKNIAVYLNQLK